MHGSLCLLSVCRAMLLLKVKSNQLWKYSCYDWKRHTSLTAANLFLLKRASLWSFWGEKI